MFFFSFFSYGWSLEVEGEREEKEEREREIVKNRVWNVRCVIKWYGINNKVVFDMVK